MDYYGTDNYTATGMNNRAIRPEVGTPLRSTTQELEKGLTEAHELLSQLENALSPVLTPEAATSASPATNPVRGGSPMVNHLSHLSSQVRGICERLRDINSRLEL